MKGPLTYDLNKETNLTTSKKNSLIVLTKEKKTKVDKLTSYKNSSEKLLTSSTIVAEGRKRSLKERLESITETNKIVFNDINTFCDEQFVPP